MSGPMGGMMVSRMIRWHDKAEGDIPREYVRLEVEGEAEVEATIVDREGNLIIANARDPGGKWFPIEIFHHEDCERCEFRATTGDPEWTLHRKNCRRHYRPIVVADGRKWAPFDPMMDRASVPTLIGFVTPQALAVLDSRDHVNRKIFSIARKAHREGGPVADILASARDSIQTEIEAHVAEHDGVGLPGRDHEDFRIADYYDRWGGEDQMYEKLRGLVEGLRSQFGADPDTMPFRDRLRRLSETTSKLPGDFYAGLARVLSRLADEADGYYATSWADLEDKRSSWLTAMADEAEARLRKMAEADRARGTPPDMM
jgi:hypothetical protein